MEGQTTATHLPATPFVFYDSDDARVYLVGCTSEQVAQATEACGPLLVRPFDREHPDFQGTGQDALRGRGLVGCARTAAAALDLPLFVDGYSDSE